MNENDAIDVASMPTENITAKNATHLISNLSYGLLAKSLLHEWQGGQLFSNTMHSTMMAKAMPKRIPIIIYGQIYSFFATF